MTPYFGNIEKLTADNEFFRHVLYTGLHAQLVVMCLNVGEEIGMEVHAAVDQFFRIEEGSGKVVADGNETPVSAGDAIVIPAGTQHNIINVSETLKLKLYTIYSPPNHPDAIIHKTKAEAISAGD